MRWLLALCALGTSGLVHLARREPPTTVRMVSVAPPRVEAVFAEPESGSTWFEAPATATDGEQLPRFSGPMPVDVPLAQGILVDDAGAPVARGEIRGMPTRAPPPAGRRGRRAADSLRTTYAVTGRVRDGVFFFHCLDVGPGESCEITFCVDSPGCVRETFVVEPAVVRDLGFGHSVEGLRFVLQRAAVVEGTVYGSDGEPVPDVFVHVVEDPQVGLPQGIANSAANGRFRLPGLDPRKRWWLVVPRANLMDQPLLLGRLEAGVVHREDLYVDAVHAPGASEP